MERGPPRKVAREAVRRGQEATGHNHLAEVNDNYRDDDDNYADAKDFADTITLS